MRAAGVPFTILRPVLIYGPSRRGNLDDRLIRLTQTTWPLPLGLCRNRRSMLARQNLISAIHFVLQQPSAKGETYIVADPMPLTLAEIVAALRAGQGRRPGLLPGAADTDCTWRPTPPGAATSWQRIGGSMVASPTKLLQAGWKPVVDTRAGLAALTAAAAPR